MEKKRKWFWIAAVLALTADLITKHYAFIHLDSIADNTDRLCPVLWLSQHINKGMVFGIGGGWRYLIVALTALLIPGITMVAYSCRDRSSPLWALGLLLGGAVGNLYDRIFVNHPLMGNGVRDFLDLRNPFNGENLWPVFNVADITILIGVLVFLGWSMLMAPEDKASEPAPEAGNQNDPEKETA